jgi:hypothetical protein
MNFKTGIIARFATMLGMTQALPFSGEAATTHGNTRYADSGAANSRTMDDATLKRAAVAYVKMRDISAEVEQAVNRTEDPIEKRELKSASKYAKMDAVKEEGMDPSEYNGVLALIKTDNGLRRKFLSYVEELKHAS